VELDPSYESVDMRVEVTTLVHIDRVPIGQSGERRRQVGFGRHCGAIDQDRDHGYVALESGFDLDPDKVPRVVDTPVSVGPPGPVLSDHDEDEVALTDSRVDVFTEVDTEGDVINVPKDGVGTEVGMKTIVDSPGNAYRIITPVGEEDLCHRSLDLWVLMHYAACPRLMYQDSWLRFD
jgi:hypothetical protein